VPAIARVGGRAHAQRHRIVFATTQAREQIGILSLGETRKFIETNELEFRRIVLVNVVVRIKIAEGDSRTEGKVKRLSVISTLRRY
jgi:hypothetical protein